MDDEYRNEPGSDDPAAAFDRLRSEVSLLRSAIEGMAAREAVEIPDYEPTLTRTEQVLTGLVRQVDGMRKSPAMTLTPETLGQRLDAAVADSVSLLRSHAQGAKTALDGAVSQLHGFVRSARTGEEQRWWLIVTGLGALLLGILLWAGFAGAVARAMPASWQWPERMAARSVDMSMWAAGQDLMASANPTAWDGIVAGDAIVRANRDAIEACRKVASKAQKSVRCVIEVKAGGPA